MNANEKLHHSLLSHLVRELLPAIRSLARSEKKTFDSDLIDSNSFEDVVNSDPSGLKIEFLMLIVR